jgi:hypothetical protein
MASDYINSLKGNFSPAKKTERKGKIGKPSTPQLNQNPLRKDKMSFGKS